MKTELKITHQELLTLLMNFDETKQQPFVNVGMITPVRMLKTNNPYYEKVFKKSSCNYKLNIDYKQSIDNNSVKEGIEQNFQVEEMKGKKHISKCVCIDTKTETTHYLMLERFDEIQPQVEYVMEGNPILKQLFEGYMNKVYVSQKQEQEKKVMVITPKIENIYEM